MLFNSFEFLLFFLPVTLIVYFTLARLSYFTVARVWLLFASLFFYSWWNPIYLPLIMSSVVFNYFVGKKLNQIEERPKRKRLLIFGVTANLALLGYFKYFNFFLENINVIGGLNIPVYNVVLPLAISFFTFQQIAYLADSFEQQTKGYDLFNYSIFVTLFPHLIAGPLVNHKDILPQLKDRANFNFNEFNFSKGLYIFFMGLGKKVIVADSFAVLANAGYANTGALNFADSWLTSLSYAFQLYFDFSGYSDMAIGAALLFNINLAINFNSPYRALNIQDFWRRWHITLSSFLRDYVYIPLGGSKISEFITLRNLMITFVLGGIWHGAGWTFIFWGFLHGLGLIIHRLWRKTSVDIPDWLAWFITFQYVNVAWVFFRAPSWTDAMALLKTMFGLNGLGTFSTSIMTDISILPMLLAGVFLLFWKNPPELAAEFKTDRKHLAYLIALTIVGLLFMNSITANDFLYFDF
jgi:D-alanyl-lipoteichoic acid acyltransferase DltB (MBOAT superfamily)